MSLPNETVEGHGHEHGHGGFDAVIPPWFLWTVYGAAAVGCAWLAYDLYRERRKADALAVLVVSRVRDVTVPVVSDEDSKPAL